MKTLATFCLSGALMGLTFVACGGEVERTYDCWQICGDYGRCVDNSTDRTDCTDKCEDFGENDSAGEAAINACENCLDDTTCLEAANQCTSVCDPVVNFALRN